MLHIIFVWMAVSCPLLWRLCIRLVSPRGSFLPLDSVLRSPGSVVTMYSACVCLRGFPVFCKKQSFECITLLIVLPSKHIVPLISVMLNCCARARFGIAYPPCLTSAVSNQHFRLSAVHAQCNYLGVWPY